MYVMKKAIIGGWLAVLGLVVLMGWQMRSSQESRADEVPGVVTEISATEAKTMLDDSEPLVLLDARTEEEFEWARIPGAILLPYDEIGERAALELPDKQARIVVYCQSGRRSALATEILMELGYRHVYNMGGIIEWSFEVEGDFELSDIDL
jgi:rhodanese-related sulfurtransferase